jgi:hypothetical protein
MPSAVIRGSYLLEDFWCHRGVIWCHSVSILFNLPIGIFCHFLHFVELFCVTVSQISLILAAFY